VIDYTDNVTIRKRLKGTSFVSELGAARDGWRYLGFSLRARGFVKILLFKALRTFIAESAAWRAISEKEARALVMTYTSCSMIQLSRRDASCSRRLTFSSRLPISLSLSAILSSRSRISSAREPASFHQPGGVSSCSLTTSLITVCTAGGSQTGQTIGVGRTPPGAPASSSASRRATSASRMATELSRATSACERFGARMPHTPVPAGSPEGVVALDGRESITARTARMRERTSRRVVEEMVR
jgi:hypothetical protein